MTHMLLAGFDKAKSDDVQAVVKALEGLEMNDIVGRCGWTAPRTRRCAPTSSCAARRKADEARADFADVVATGTRRCEGIRRLQGHRKLLSLPL